jgi:hypothetical protein
MPVGHGPIPDLGAGGGGERDQMRIESLDINVLAEHRDAPVGLTATLRDIRRQRAIELPEDRTGPGIEGRDALRRLRHEHPRPDHDRRGLLVAAVRRQVRDPGQAQIANVCGRDPGERTMAGSGIVTGIGEPIPALLACSDHLRRDWLISRNRIGRELLAELRRERRLPQERLDLPDLDGRQGLRPHGRSRAAPFDGGKELPIAQAADRGDQVGPDAAARIVSMAARADVAEGLGARLSGFAIGECVADADVDVRFLRQPVQVDGTVRRRPLHEQSQRNLRNPAGEFVGEQPLPPGDGRGNERCREAHDHDGDDRKQQHLGRTPARLDPARRRLPIVFVQVINRPDG